MNVSERLRGAAQARRLIAPLLRTWYRVTVFEAESVPRNGPVLLVANHIGLLDAALLATASPRPVRTLAAEDLFAPPLDRLSQAAGQIRIDPVNADAGALTSARRVLTDGEVLAVFPEGVRGDGDVRSIGHEAAYLALRSGAPVVPVALLGTRRAGMATDALPRRNTRLAAVFGTPFELHTGDDVCRRGVIASAGETLRQRLADTVAAAQTMTGLRLPDPEVSGGS